MTGSKSGRFKLFDDAKQMNGLDDSEPDKMGRAEYDDLGRAVWTPYKGLAGRRRLSRLLDDKTLEIAEDDSQAVNSQIRENRTGVVKGFDPYDSGMLVKKGWKKNKDLRALSQWIVKNKKHDPDE